MKEEPRERKGEGAPFVFVLGEQSGTCPLAVPWLKAGSYDIDDIDCCRIGIIELRPLPT
jgi:hypothetical protein